MSSLNQVTLIGNVGKDPEIRRFDNGGQVINLTLATSERWRDKESGERKEVTEWHRITCFNEKLGEIIDKYVRKGSKICVQGQLKTRKWKDQSGAERYTTEIVLPKFGGTLVMLSGAGERGSTGGDKQPQRTPQAANALDDDIPF